MKNRHLLACVMLLPLLLDACATFEQYKVADEYTSQIRSLAVLPIVVGDRTGRIQRLGTSELDEFLRYFQGRFYADFERDVSLNGGIDLKLPDRDFALNVYNGMDYAEAARKLGVDAVLAVNLTLYNEVSPAAGGAEVVGAVVTTLLFGGYVVEKRVVGYETHYAYLDAGQIEETLSFEFIGGVLPSIEDQRRFFVDALLAHLDTFLPLSTDYVKPYSQ